MKKIGLLSASLLLSGCTSLGEGLMNSFLEKQETVDTRICKIEGKPFGGVQASLNQAGTSLKLLMVHGVGTHVPGYSTQFQEKLATELALPVKSSRYKEIKLINKEFPEKDLGTLRVRRLLNEAKNRELLFYELTWSAISNSEKKKLAYDTSGEYSYQRADINQMLKQFSNDTSPDPMIYLGKSRALILASFRTAFCWMAGRNWNSLPHASETKQCVVDTQMFGNLMQDNYAIVSHSLGSRIVIDGMQSIAARVSDTRHPELDSVKAAFVENFQQKHISFYMMSNQLPLLEMGQIAPKIVGQNDAYCLSGSAEYKHRLVQKTSIIAFSDPNDLLSYGIPQDFIQTHLDSRLCAEITNVTINIAHVMDILGLGEFANPLTAHTGYDSDDRVVALIAKGIGKAHTAEVVDERCQWTEYVD